MRFRSTLSSADLYSEIIIIIQIRIRTKWQWWWWCCGGGDVVGCLMELKENNFYVVCLWRGIRERQDKKIKEKRHLICEPNGKQMTFFFWFFQWKDQPNQKPTEKQDRPKGDDFSIRFKLKKEKTAKIWRWWAFKWGIKIMSTLNEWSKERRKKNFGLKKSKRKRESIYESSPLMFCHLE